jgi:hypothetical protein
MLIGFTRAVRMWFLRVKKKKKKKKKKNLKNNISMREKKRYN